MKNRIHILIAIDEKWRGKCEWKNLIKILDRSIRMKCEYILIIFHDASL